jgi:hypothetical protein
MSDPTDGRGLASDEFDDDEIDWDDEPATGEESDGLSPIEKMVGESMDVVVPDDDRYVETDDEDD